MLGENRGFPAIRTSNAQFLCKHSRLLSIPQRSIQILLRRDLVACFSAVDKGDHHPSLARDGNIVGAASVMSAMRFQDLSIPEALRRLGPPKAFPRNRLIRQVSLGAPKCIDNRKRSASPIRVVQR